MSLPLKSIATLSHDLKTGDVSSRQLVEQSLARIDTLNPQLNAVVCLEAEQALANADQADAKRAKGEDSPLLGIPMLHKDIFCTQGMRTTKVVRAAWSFDSKSNNYGHDRTWMLYTDQP